MKKHSSPIESTYRDNLDAANRPLAPSELTANAARQADLVCLSDIEHRPVEWLWQDRLAIGNT